MSYAYSRRGREELSSTYCQGLSYSYVSGRVPTLDADEHQQRQDNLELTNKHRRTEIVTRLEI